MGTMVNPSTYSIYEVLFNRTLAFRPSPSQSSAYVHRQGSLYSARHRLDARSQETKGESWPWSFGRAQLRREYYAPPFHSNFNQEQIPHVPTLSRPHMYLYLRRQGSLHSAWHGLDVRSEKTEGESLAFVLRKGSA